MLALLFTHAANATPTACHVTVTDPSGVATLQRIELADGASRAESERVVRSLRWIRGLVVDGDVALVCLDDELVTFALASGAVTSTGRACSVIGGGSAVLIGEVEASRVRVYADATAAAEGSAPSELTLHNVGQLAVEGERVFVVPMVGVAVHVRDASTGAFLASVFPEGVATAIRGLDVRGGEAFLLDDGRPEDGEGPPVPAIRWYDVDTWALRGEVGLSLEPGAVARGLSCAGG